MSQIHIEKLYKFTLKKNKINDTAVATFYSPYCRECFTVVLRCFATQGLGPFFDALEDHPDIISSCSTLFLKDIWETIYPDHPFVDRIREDFSHFGFLKPKVFRTEMHTLPLEPEFQQSKFGAQNEAELETPAKLRRSGSLKRKKDHWGFFT